jgi:hypothetical protein
MPRALADLSDTELQSIANGAPPLENLDDHELTALATSQGLMQPDEAHAAVVEKRRAERAPIADALASGLMPMVPAPLARAVLTRGGRVGDIAAEVLPPIAGAIVGMPGGLPGVAAGGALGGAAGNVISQARQYFRGERDTGSTGELAAATLTSAVPLGGPLLKTAGRVIATRAVQGAGIAAAGDAVRQGIDTGTVDFTQLAQAGALGALFGGGAGAAEAVATRKMVLRAVRGTPEFAGFEGTDAELTAAVKQRMAEAVPPAPEPRNVTPETPATPAAPARAATPAPAADLAPTPGALAPAAPSAPAAAPRAPVAFGPNGQPLVDVPPVAPGEQIEPAKPLRELTDDQLRAEAVRSQLNPDVLRIPPLAELPRFSNADLKTLEDLIVDRSTGPAEIVPTGRAAVGPRLKFSPRPDGITDIIDAIQETGGVPRPPAGQGERGGEWDGHEEVFRGPAKILLSKSTGGLDTYLDELAGAFPQFEGVRGNPDAFRSEVMTALRERVTAKANVQVEQNTQRFLTAALDGKGRGPGEAADAPISTDTLNVGAKFKVKKADFEVTGVSDDGVVTVKDGPKYGTQTLPPGALLHPDRGSLQPVDNLTNVDFAPNDEPATAKPLADLTDAELLAAQDSPPNVQEPTGQTAMFSEGEAAFNLASEEQRATAAPVAPTEQTAEMFGAEVRSTAPTALDRANADARGAGIAQASPGRPVAAIEGTAPEPFNPADDPTHSQLPIQLPEMVQFFKMISGGKVPAIVEKIRLLHGTALGVFRARVGQVDSGRIELRADLFQLVPAAQKQKLLEDAIAWATLMKQADPALNLREAIRQRFEQLVKAAEAEAMTKDPKRALDVFAHEIGHYVDFMPDAVSSRGNILGRIASLKRYLKGFIGENPGISATPPNEAERAKFKRQAERELAASVKEITETIRREVPVYAEIPITAEQITSILKQAQRDEFPELYDWFARLDRAEKVAVLRQAMKGIVDERAARFAARTQTGTKIVEETVTRRVGTEPTPENIRARYAELLRAELKRRGLISQKDIRAELEGAIAWWHGAETMPVYFRTSEEMYAETFSILLNNPAGLAKRAPTFYRAFFNYLARKPEVKAAYEKLQTDIRSGVIERQRVENLRGAFRSDEDSGQLQDIASTQTNWRKVRDTLRLLLDRQHGPIEARALRRLDRPESKKVLSALKDYLYRATAVEGYARELNLRVESQLAAANLRHDDLAEFMFHRRIVAGDRKELANAQGWSPNTSGQRLAEMARDLGPQRFAALEAAQQANREIYEQRVVNLLERADILTPELLTLIRERTLYATFAKTREFNPLEHDTIEGLLTASYGKEVSSRIYRQIGYLGDIRSPYLAMTQKAFALINLAYKQMAVKSLVDFLGANDPHMITEAEQVFTGKGWRPRIVDTAKVGTLLVLDKGEAKGYYVPRQISETLEQAGPLESMIVGFASHVLALPKALLTELNAGFWPVAFAKDVATLGLQLPRGLSSFKQLPQAHAAARATYTGAENKLADAALSRLMVISRADPRGEHMGHPDEMTRLLLRMGQNPQLWDAEAEKISRLMRTWMWWKRQGAILERTIKIAGMMHLDTEAFATMPEWMKKRIVNELAGSPDFLEKGRAAAVVEMAGGPIFYNAWLQGMRSFKRAAQANPREFWTKFLAFFGLPSLAFYAFEKGLFDMGLSKEEAENQRDLLRSIPERDKLRGFVVPLGWADKTQGKATYLVLPYPDQVRYLNAGLRKMAQTAGADGAKEMGMASLVQFQGEDLPGQNPLVSEGMKWWRFAALGQNPYDSFRGGPSLDADVFKAGQGAGELAKQSASNLTGGIIYKYKSQRPGDTPTGLESFMQLPGVGNLLGRWLRVSNAGLTEEANRATAPVIQHEAQMRLIGDVMGQKLLKGEPWSETETKLAQNEPYLVQHMASRMSKMMVNATSPELRALSNAKSAAEKMALLNAWDQRTKERTERLKAK